MFVGWGKKKSDCVVSAFVVYSSWEEMLVGCWFDHFQFVLRERGSERRGGSQREGWRGAEVRREGWWVLFNKNNTDRVVRN